MSDSYLPDNEPRDILLSFEELAVKKLPHAPMFKRAADEITRLRAENEKLRARSVLIPESVQKIIDDYPAVCAERDSLAKLADCRLRIASRALDKCEKLEKILKLCGDEGKKYRSDLAAITEELDRLRDVLKPFSDAASTDDYVDDIEIAETDTARKITFGDLRRARAALEGVTEPPR